MLKPANTAFYKMTALLAAAIMLLSACQQEFQNRPTLSPTFSPTITYTPTITSTFTTVPTVTPTPSKTPTATLTPRPTRTSTPTATPVVQQPASLFEFFAGGDHLVDWEYIYVTERGMGIDDKVNSLSAMLAFQLMDRAIHTEMIDFLDEDITVYYLNVQHQFDDEVIPMRLVIGGTYGVNVPIDQIPADGSNYVEFIERDTTQVFEPWVIHQQAQLPYEGRQFIFNTMLMQDFEQYLVELPDELIILAEHPILWPKDDLPWVKLNMSRISAVAARYLPFLQVDIYNRIVGPSTNAYSLAAFILADEPLPEGNFSFSARTLIFIVPLLGNY